MPRGDTLGPPPMRLPTRTDILALFKAGEQDIVGVPAPAWCGICADNFVYTRDGIRIPCPCARNEYANAERAQYSILLALGLGLEMTPKPSDAANLACGACGDFREIITGPDTVRRCPCTWNIRTHRLRHEIAARTGRVRPITSAPKITGSHT